MSNKNIIKRLGLYVMMVAACLAWSGAQAATYTVINTNNSGIGSLRQAILNANANAGTDTIAFNIPGGGPHTIEPLSVLPGINDPVDLNGFSQPGASQNTNPVGQGINAVLMIELDGTLLGTGIMPRKNGLNLYAGNSIVRGLVINNFHNKGIEIGLGGGNMIEGNFIAGNSGFGSVNLGGVTVESSDNIIGGTTPEARNVISGNFVSGVFIGSGVANTAVQGNLIGTDVTGLNALPNLDGLYANGTSNTTIGGITAAARNVISGNIREGVSLGPTGALPDQLLGNYIGTDITGLSALGNGQNGVRVVGHNKWVGGAAAGAGNVISGNGVYGVSIVGSGTTDNLVQGNLIGTNSTGTGTIGNGSAGVFVHAVAGNIIGGTNSGDGNLISGNNIGVDIRTAGTIVEGNLIGTDISGTESLGNISYGVYLADNATDNTIEGNVISGNGVGIKLVHSNVMGNEIQGNSIYSNIGLGIDLGDAGVTANDPGDADAGANNRQNYPVLTSTASTSTSTIIEGTLNSTPNTVFSLEFFSNLTCDSSGFGEGESSLGLTVVTTDGSGDVSFVVNLPFAIAAGEVITSTATDPGGNTSEFSQCDVVVADSDFDGIPDDEDTCPNSDLGLMVVIDGCDTGVTNVLLNDGCTISDLIADCAANVSNHGEFVSCIAHLTNDLQKGGIISGKEKGRIQKCAAQAIIP